jgi:hypothetical protein
MDEFHLIKNWYEFEFVPLHESFNELVLFMRWVIEIKTIVESAPPTPSINCVDNIERVTIQVVGKMTIYYQVVISFFY